MSDRFEVLRSPERSVGSGEGSENLTVSGDYEGDPFAAPTSLRRAVDMTLDDCDDEPIETINALKSRRESLVKDLIKIAEEVSAIDAAIFLVAKVHIE